MCHRQRTIFRTVGIRERILGRDNRHRSRISFPNNTVDPPTLFRYRKVAVEKNSHVTEGSLRKPTESRNDLSLPDVVLRR